MLLQKLIYLTDIKAVESHRMLIARLCALFLAEREATAFLLFKNVCPKMPRTGNIQDKGVNNSNSQSTPDSTKALSKKIKDLKEQVKVECDAKNIAYDFILATGNYALFVAFHKARMRGDVDFDRLKFIISTLKKKEEHP